MFMQTKPSIVFVHGIWADGSSFSKVIPALRAEGHEVIAAQYGLDTLAGDVAAVKHTLGRVISPAILVGHSYGGAVITAAGTDDRVAGAGLRRRPRPGCRRDVAEPAGSVCHHRHFLPHRSRRGAGMDAPARCRVLRGRPVRPGAEARLGDSVRAGRGPVQPEA